MNTRQGCRQEGGDWSTSPRF